MVDLPDPLSPTSPSVSPSRIAKETPSTARRAGRLGGRNRPRLLAEVGPASRWTRRRALGGARCDSVRAGPAGSARDQGAGVRDRLGCGEHRAAAGPALDDAAVLHHADMVGITPDDAEVMADQEEGQAALALSPSARRSRICAWIVTSSAVVGSSAISRGGSLAKRHSDGHTLPLPAGQLVRQRVQAAGARPGSRQDCEQRHHHDRGPAGWPCSRHRLGHLAARRRAAGSGWSSAPGTRCPRCGPGCGAGSPVVRRAAMGWPSSDHLRPVTWPPPRGSNRSDRQRGERLAGPALPHQARASGRRSRVNDWRRSTTALDAPGSGS